MSTNFRISTKFLNFNQISKFQPNFRIGQDVSLNSVFCKCIFNKCTRYSDQIQIDSKCWMLNVEYGYFCQKCLKITILIPLFLSQTSRRVFSYSSWKHLDQSVYSHISCICLVFLHCAFSNVSSNCLPQKRHSRIGCICLTFLQCAFSNVS